MLKRLKLKLYNYNLKNHPNAMKIFSRYKIMNYDFHNKNKLKSLGYLFKLIKAEKKGKNLFDVKPPKVSNDFLNLDYLNNFQIDDNSLQIKRLSVEEMVEKLSVFDVVSFDVFDTCIFRPFEKPSDLFELLEKDLNIPGFKNARIVAEKNVRKKKVFSEITLEEIYNEMSSTFKIAKMFMNQEIYLELKMCYANPYMLDVYKKLKENNKTIVFTSEMYLPTKTISEIIIKNGFTEFENIYVSSEYDCFKGDGKLFEVVKQDYKNGETIIHVGDSFDSDIAGAKIAGIESYHYKKCTLDNKKEKTLATSMAVAVGNNYLNCGSYELTNAQALAFKYVGLCVSGYCEWINEFAQENKVDKILFLSRDMDIVCKVYNQHYKQFDNEYVTVSRTALLKLIIKDNPKEFFEDVIKARCDKGQTIQHVFKQLEFDDLFVSLKDYGLKYDDFLTNDNIKKVEKLFFDNLNTIINTYSKFEEPALEYFKSVIGGVKNVCVVDLGWRGSNIIYLNMLLTKTWKLCDRVYGVMLGCVERQNNLNLIKNKTISAYAFSPLHNVGLMKGKDWREDEINIQILESIFTSGEQPLLGYEFDKNKQVKFKRFGHNLNTQIISELHDGILKFVNEFACHRSKIKHKIEINALECFGILTNLFKDYLLIAKIMGEIVDSPHEPDLLTNVKEERMSLAEKLIEYGLLQNKKNN